MTDVRVAQADEIPTLVEVPGDPTRNAATADYLAGLLTSGCTRPEWCLVAVGAEGRPTGSIVLWTAPGRSVPMDFVLFEAPDAAVGAALLAAAGGLARDLGAERQGHVLDSPAQAPQFQRDPEFREKMLVEAGFTLDRDGCRFSWTAADPLPAQDPRLTWQSLATLGEAPFVDLLTDAFADTADSIFQAEIAEHGRRGAAELNLRECLEFDHEPQWFEIGFDASGTPAALSLPARNAVFPIVSLIGVATAHRGKGFATAAVARATQTLANAGATEIRGDCDRANVAMYHAFQRAGYTNFADRKMFDRTLAR